MIYWSGGGYAHANTFYTHLSMANKRESWLSKISKSHQKGDPFLWSWRGVAWWRGGRGWVESA